MASSPKLQLPLLLISLSVLSAFSQPEASPPPPPPPQSIINAADTLAESGHNAMSLTLELIAPTLSLPASAALTIFSPPDAAFAYSGQPSRSLCLLHFSPLSLSPASLLSLPFATTIPSLSPSKHLFITSNQTNRISINGVRVSESPISDDGLVIVYAIDGFFNPNFTLAAGTPIANPKPDLQCLNLDTASRFKEASGVLRSRGYAIVASFLDLQLTGFSRDGDVMRWTVFAPGDGELMSFGGDFPAFASLFMRHLAPCKVEFSDLEGMENGTVVSKSVNGNKLEITRDEGEQKVMVSGVQITFPDLYKNDWLVIHGVRGVIVLPVNGEEEMGNKEDEVSKVPDDVEYDG